MVYYTTCGQYVTSCKTLFDKIAAIDAIIDALEMQALDSGSGPGANLTEYKLNDGQTIISQIYRGPSGIADAINKFEAIKQKYVNRLNGRVHRLIPSKNFPHGGY